MALRIDQVGTTLKVSGRLVGPWIPELAKAFDALAGAAVVDISDVTFVASDGVELLRQLLTRGAEIRGCPAYLAPQLFGSTP